MSRKQLDAVIKDVTAVFSSWGPKTPLNVIRDEYDNLFADVVSVVKPKRQDILAGGVKAEWISASTARHDKAVLYLHGGGFVIGSVKSHRDVCERLSRQLVRASWRSAIGWHQSILFRRRCTMHSQPTRGSLSRALTIAISPLQVIRLEAA